MENPVVVGVTATRDRDGLIQNDELNCYPRTEKTEYVLYPWRWYILAVVCVLNFSNALLWLTYSPITDIAAEFYSVESVQIDYLSLVFMIASVPVGLTATWLLDTYGLRFGTLLGAWLNVCGAAIRVISSLSAVPSDYMFPVVMLGQTISAISQPYIMFLPTKMAALWFSDDQRAIANTIASMSNPLGIMAANILAPIIVQDTTDMLKMNLSCLAPAVLGVTLVTLGMCSSRPPSPPSPSAADTTAASQSFLTGLKMVVRNKPFLILCVCLGAGIGLFSTLTTVLEQIVCARGYSNEFAGICGTLLIALGILGAAVAGIVVDRTKKFEEVAKLSLGLATFAAIFFAIISTSRDTPVALATSCALFGLFGFAVYPIGLELGVECTYPVAEATSAGLIIMSGQVQGIIYVLLMTQVLQRPLPDYDLQFETCTVKGPPPSHGRHMGHNVTRTTTTPRSVTPWVTPAGPQHEGAYDMTVSNLTFAGITTLISCVFIIFFRTKYHRLIAERLQQTDRVLTFGGEQRRQQQQQT